MVALAQEPCGRGQLAVALGEAEISVLLAWVPAWRREGGRLVRDFAFADYHHTMAFVNAVAGVAHEAAITTRCWSCVTAAAVSSFSPMTAMGCRARISSARLESTRSTRWVSACAAVTVPESMAELVLLDDVPLDRVTK
ncbi:hypothetical protein MASR2M16_35360 [Thauera terpenica]